MEASDCGIVDKYGVEECLQRFGVCLQERCEAASLDTFGVVLGLRLCKDEMRWESFWFVGKLRIHTLYISMIEYPPPSRSSNMLQRSITDASLEITSLEVWTVYESGSAFSSSSKQRVCTDMVSSALGGMVNENGWLKLGFHECT